MVDCFMHIRRLASDTIGRFGLDEVQPRLYRFGHSLQELHMGQGAENMTAVVDTDEWVQQYVYSVQRMGRVQSSSTVSSMKSRFA